jgi:hypothetical protein
LHPFDDELDPDPDPNHIEKADSDPHQRDADPQYLQTRATNAIHYFLSSLI